MISEGLVRVNGEVETSKRKKCCPVMCWNWLENNSA
jgi:hypothetical protein